MPISKIEAAGRGTGAVIQVVRTSLASAGFSSTSYVSILSQAITPISNTSKILVLFNATGYIQGGASVYRTFRVRVVRDGTVIKVNEQGIVGSNNGWEYTANFTSITYDSPATTAAVTYNIQANTDGTAAAMLSGTNNIELILMEIAA